MITVNIKGDKEVGAMLRGIAARADNLTPAMNLIGQIVRSSVIKNFMEGGRTEKWKPSLRVKKEGGKTLVDKAILQNSISYKATANRAEIGTNVKYAAIHQFGGTIKAKNKPYLKFNVAGRWAQKKQVKIPKRPYLVIQKEDWTEMRDTLAEHSLRGVKR